MYPCVTLRDLALPGRLRHGGPSKVAPPIHSELVGGRLIKTGLLLNVKKKEEMKQQSKREKWLHVRLNQSEYEKIQVQFKATTCRKLSDFTRKKLLGQLLVGTVRNASLDALTEELAQLKTELSASGNNFNQAVKKLHTLSKIKEFEQWLIGYELDRRALLRQVERVSEYISKAAERW